MERKTTALNYPLIADKLGYATLVGMGESTHGTHEFFEAKAEIFKMLVKNRDFNTLFFESVDDKCEALDRYVATGDGDPEALVRGLFYFYRSYEILDLVKWLRSNYETNPVRIVGIDERKYVDDYTDYTFDKMNLRDRRMAEVVKRNIAKYPDTKGVIWAHDTHVAAYVNAPLRLDQYKPMGRHLRRWYKNNYYNVSLLFGSGRFSAALIEESGASNNSNLVTHATPPLTDDFWEYKFTQHVHEPAFIERSQYGALALPHEIRKKRSLGWGVKQSEVNNAFIWFDLYHAYDAVLFFPHATASHRLDDQGPSSG